MNAISAYLTTLVFVAQQRLGKASKGATAVEYGLLVALIAAVIITAVTLFGNNLATMFTRVASYIK
jgi:pilus assembly protein Flp/PilA